MSYTVGLSVYNEAKNLPQLLDFLLGEGIPEILVYNDGSTDQSKTILDRYEAPNLKIYHSPINQGFSVGFNWILDNASNDIIVNVDGDTFPEKEAIRKLVDPLLRSRKVGASCGTHIIGRRSRKTIIDRLNDRIYTAKYRLDLYNNRLKEFSHLNGLLLAFKRSCIEGLVLDNANIDVYLGYKILEKGYEVRFIPEAKSYFYPPSTIPDYINSRNRVIQGHYVLAYDYKIRDYLFHEVDFPIYAYTILTALPLSLRNLFSLGFGILVDLYFRVIWFTRVKRNPKTFNRVKWKYLSSTKEIVVYA